MSCIRISLNKSLASQIDDSRRISNVDGFKILSTYLRYRTLEAISKTTCMVILNGAKRSEESIQLTQYTCFATLSMTMTPKFYV